MSQRTQNGVPAFEHKGENVIVADALAALAGVNFTSVVKVLIALELLREVGRCSTPDLVALASIPLDHAYSPDADQSRVRGVTTLLQDILAMDAHHELKDSLRLHDRGIASPYRL